MLESWPFERPRDRFITIGEVEDWREEIARRFQQARLEPEAAPPEAEAEAPAPEAAEDAARAEPTGETAPEAAPEAEAPPAPKAEDGKKS